MKTDLTPTQRAIIEEIFERMRVGDSLRQACVKARANFGKLAPYDAAGFLRWIEGHTDLEQQYARARRTCHEFLFDEIKRLSEESKRAETKGEVQGYRNMIDALKWQLSKMDPGRYGDRVAVTGPDGGPVNSTPVVVQIAGMDPIAASRAYQDFVNGPKT